MDPLSIAASSFGIVGAIAKASISIIEFSQQAKDAADDLQRVSSELQALSAILDPLARNVSRAPQGTVPAALAEQLGSSLDGCALVVARIETAVEKYQKDGAWTRTKWVMFGRGDVEKLRSSLEAYKMALSLGLHVVSIAVEANIKDDTSAIRNDTQALRQETAAIQVNTEEILARVMSLRNGARTEVGSRTRQWVDSMAVLSSYAESSYQDTVIDLGEERDIAVNDTGIDTETVRGELPALEEIPEFFQRLELSDEEERPRGVTGGSGADDGSMGGVSNASAEVSVRQKHLKTEDPVEASSSLDTREPPKWTLESRQAVDTTYHINASLITVPANIIDGSLQVVVALDIGGTSAAVAWVSHNILPQVIRDWPGGEGSRVPFRVVHDENDIVLRWGFQCGQSPKSQTDCLDRSFTLFLRQLHGYISQTITATMGLKPSDWPKMGVEFHISTPDLLRTLPPQMLSRRMGELKDQMRKSGIGTGGPRHCAVLGVTETEAAAISALGRLRAPTSHQQRLVLKIGLNHATILLVERSRTGTKIHSFQSVRTPDPRSPADMEGIVSTWLEENHPEIFESLGPGGLGRLTQLPTYYDVLDGTAPLRKSYTLRFDAVPESFSHSALGIKDGTVQLDRAQVDHILNYLVNEISKRVIDALVDCRAKFHSPPEVLHGIITLEAADTPRYFARCIADALEQKSEMGPRAASYKTASQQNSATDMDEKVMLWLTPAPLTRFGDRTFAAVEGLLIHRNPWTSMHHGRAVFRGLMSARLYTRARLQAPEASSSDEPSLYVERRYSSGTDTWSPTPGRITQHWQVSNYRCQPSDRKRLSLDIYYTYNSERPETERLGSGNPKKLCTVAWELEPWKFQSRAKKTKWWVLGVKQETLEFTTYCSLMCPLNTGPRFQLLVPGEEFFAMPKSVEWHTEPPFLVWPAESKRNEGED